jgi:hypothetical protein
LTSVETGEAEQETFKFAGGGGVLVMFTGQLAERD